MTIEIADPGELARAARTLARQRGDARDAVAAVRAHVASIGSLMADAVERRRRALSNAQAAAASGGSTDIAEPRRRFELALEAQSALVHAARELESETKRFAFKASDVAQRGERDLAIVGHELGAGRAAFAARDELSQSLGGVAVAGATGASAAARAGGGSQDGGRIGQSGMVAVPLASIDASDTTVHGPEAFGKVSYDDVRVGLVRLEETVLPAVATGAGREHFVALDQRSGLTGTPASYAVVYDSFFGQSPIKLSPQANGTYSVVNGYHRLYAAQAAGCTTLPAYVVGRGGP